MAFKRGDLSVLAYANGFTLFHHRNLRDNLDSVKRSGYFNEAADLMAPGDMLLNAALDGACLLIVTSTRLGDAGHVSTAPMS